MSNQFRHSRSLRTLALCAVVVGAATLASCGGAGEPSRANLDLVRAGNLTVGTDPSLPPFGFREGSNYRGFDIDIAGQIARELGLRLRIQGTTIDTLLAETARGDVDLAASALVIRPVDEEIVDFSEPYAENPVALITGSDSRISSVDDLSGAIVAVVDGSAAGAYANQTLNPSRVRGFFDVSSVLGALRAGKVEAAILDLGDARDAVQGDSDAFEVVQLLPTGELLGLAVAKENADLLDSVDRILGEMKEDGRLNTLYRKWFGIDMPESVAGGG